MLPMKARSHILMENDLEAEFSMAETFGERLKRLREGKGYSLEQLAVRTSSSKSHLWELEKGRAPVPGGEKLALLARELDTTVHALAVEETDPDSADEQDRVFFRNYRSLDEGTRENMRTMVAALKKKP